MMSAIRASDTGEEVWGYGEAAVATHLRCLRHKEQQVTKRACGLGITGCTGYNIACLPVPFLEATRASSWRRCKPWR